MRTYEGETKMPPKNKCGYWERFAKINGDISFKHKTDGTYSRSAFGVRRGLKLIHIGDGVWRIGKECKLNDGRLHQIIYSPDDKEYHLYGEAIIDSLRGYVNKHGNQADESKVKVYILTSILDERTNWCFDLKKIPESGRLKVIYSNGKVMNVEFDGCWYSYNLNTRSFTENSIADDDSEKFYRSYGLIHPVAYRITNHVV